MNQMEKNINQKFIIKIKLNINNNFLFLFIYMGKTDNIFILLILLVFVAIFYFSFNSYNKPIKSILESFSNMNIDFQNGISSITPTGSIKFEKPFGSIPQIFTQIFGDSSISGNAYSVQVFNITTTGFDYSKKKIMNQPIPGGSGSVVRFDDATTESFNWIALTLN